MRLRNLQLLFGGALALLFWARPALAGPVDDVLRGSGLHLNGAAITIDGHPYSTSNYELPKAPGTLELVLNGMDFGLGADLPVHLHGSASGNTITWTFSEHLTTPYVINALYSVTDLQGAIVVNASALPGPLATLCSGSPCPYNVSLANAPGTWIRIQLSGPFWDPNPTKDVTVDWLQLLGGLPRPALASFSVRTPSRLCAASGDTYLMGQVGLTSIAPSGGSWVEVTSSDSSAIRVEGVRVAEGTSWAPIRLVVRGGFAGSVLVTAAAGGATSTQEIDVLPADQCRQIFFKVIVPRELIPQWLLGCIACTQPIDLNNDGAALARVSGRPVYYSPQLSLVDLDKLLGAKDVSPARLNAFGALTGTLVDAYGKSRGFYLASADGSAKPVDLGALTPSAVNELGVVAGSRPGQSGPIAGYFNGAKLLDLALSATWSQVLTLNNAGAMVGTYGTANGTRAFLATASKVTDLGSLGGDTTPAGINEGGTVALSSKTTAGTWMACSYDAKNGLQKLGVLSGFVNSRALAINRAGWIAGTADDGKGFSHGFLYTPGNGLIDLNALVDPQSGLEVIEALALTDDGALLVRARLKGQVDTYVLSP